MAREKKSKESKLSNGGKTPAKLKPGKSISSKKSNSTKTSFLINDNFDNLSDLSFVIGSDGKILSSSKPSKKLKIIKNSFIGKDVFLFYKNDLEKENFLKEISVKKSITKLLSLEYEKNRDIKVISRWNIISKRGKEIICLVLNFIPDIQLKSSSLQIGLNLEDEFTWISMTGIRDRKTNYSANIEKITGYTQKEINRKADGFFSIINDEYYQSVVKKYNDFLSDQNKHNLSLIYRLLRKDKKTIWVKEVIIVERNKKGIPSLSQGKVLDITELMKTDDTLVKSIENLKKVNSSKDKFISMLSHDLRAPFTSILGFAEILINEENLSNTEKLEYLTYIHESSQNQLQLINYLLDWSRLQTGRMKITVQRLHAQTVVFNCVSSLTGNAIRKNIDIKVRVNEKIYVQGDERLLGQVITNLLSNAIKFSSSDKIIEIIADIFNDNLIEFIVKDQGIGISDQNKSKLFKIEKMFSTEGTKGEKGTGLGLSLVKEIIEKHKGEIWFYSEADKGSEFHFTIPRSQNIILIVDNDLQTTSICENLIKSNFPKFNIISTENGYEAMGIVLEKLPSLVITEHEMPLMNGVQLIEAIRREEKNFSIPVILLTDEISDAIRKSYQNLNVYTMLQKPLNTQQFLEKLFTGLRI